MTSSTALTTVSTDLVNNINTFKKFGNNKMTTFSQDVSLIMYEAVKTVHVSLDAFWFFIALTDSTKLCIYLFI